MAPLAAGPSIKQRRVLVALASRPAARIKYFGYGLLITDGRGWADYLASNRLTGADVAAMGQAGWIITQRDALGRIEYAISLAGREAIGA